MSAIVRSADGESEAAACFAVMAQRRPHLADAAEFALLARRQRAGHRLLGAWREGVPVALAGNRFAENRAHGRFVDVGDLAATKDARGGGLGGRLPDAVLEEAREHGSERLVLDTALDNVLAHRFYSRQGLLALALRFSRPVAR